MDNEDLDLDASIRPGTGSYLGQGTDGYSLWSATLAHAKKIGLLKQVPAGATGHLILGAAAA